MFFMTTLARGMLCHSMSSQTTNLMGKAAAIFLMFQPKRGGAHAHVRVTTTVAVYTLLIPEALCCNVPLQKIQSEKFWVSVRLLVHRNSK